MGDLTRLREAADRLSETWNTYAILADEFMDAKGASVEVQLRWVRGLPDGDDLGAEIAAKGMAADGLRSDVAAAAREFSEAQLDFFEVVLGRRIPLEFL